MQTAMRRSVGTASTAAARFAARPASASQSSAIAAARTIATSARTAEEKKSSGLLKSILHGSEKAKAEAPQVPGLDGSAGGARGGQHSQMVGRGKYIHELYKHKVKPGKVQEYRKLVEEFYTSLANNPEYDMKLTGSWEVVVGELDTFCGAPSLPHDMLTGNELTMSTSAFVNAIDHVWEHNGFHGLDLLMPKLAADKKYQDFQAKLAPMLNSRTSQLIQEFSFWPSSPPKQLGGVYEMRNYTLKPGTLLEWEQEWRVGLDARKKFVEPIAAFFSQVGELHQVIHMWHYESLDARKQMRQRAWEIDTWSATVAKTVKLADHMSAQILQPLPFSPLR